MTEIVRKPVGSKTQRPVVLNVTYHPLTGDSSTYWTYDDLVENNLDQNDRADAREMEIAKADDRVHRQFGTGSWYKFLGTLAAGAGMAGLVGIGVPALFSGSTAVVPELTIGQLPWWLTAIGTAARSMATGMVADEISKGFTGQSIGLHIKNSTSLLGSFGEGLQEATPEMAWDLANPFYSFNPLFSGYTIRTMANKINFKIPHFRPKIQDTDYIRTLSTEHGNPEEAILEMLGTGEIRANPKGTWRANQEPETYIAPYFRRGFSLRDFSKDITHIYVNNGKDPSLLWVPIEPHATTLKIDNGARPEQFTPFYNGVYNHVPANKFDLWYRGNNFLTKHFWFKRSLKNVRTPDPVIPFDFGKGSNILIHMDHGDHTGFNGDGSYIVGDILHAGSPPEGLRPYVWFNIDKPYAEGIDGKPFTRAFILHKDELPAFLVRSMKEKVGLWDPDKPKKSFVTKQEYVIPDWVLLSKGALFEYDGSNWIYKSSNLYHK